MFLIRLGILAGAPVTVASGLANLWWVTPGNLAGGAGGVALACRHADLGGWGRMKRFLDANHPFFAPVWRRWATGLLPIGWGVAELALGSPGWAILFVGIGGYALYELIWKGPTSL